MTATKPTTPDMVEPAAAAISWNRSAPPPWAPPAAEGTTWPKGLTPDAWPVVDPGPRPEGRWVSTGFRASSSHAAWLARGLAVLTLSMAVGAMVVAAGGAIGGAAWTPAIAMAEVIVVAVAAATFLVALAWLERAVSNVPPLTGRTPWLSPLQIAGLCCVPGFHLVVPCLALDDLAARVRLPGQTDVRRLVRAWAVIAALAQALAVLVFIGPYAGRSSMTVAALLTGAAATALLMALVNRIEDRSSTLAVLLRMRVGASTSRWPAFPEAPAADDGGETERLGDLVAPARIVAPAVAEEVAAEVVAAKPRRAPRKSSKPKTAAPAVEPAEPEPAAEPEARAKTAEDRAAAEPVAAVDPEPEVAVAVEPEPESPAPEPATPDRPTVVKPTKRTPRAPWKPSIAAASGEAAPSNPPAPARRPARRRKP